MPEYVTITWGTESLRKKTGSCSLCNYPLTTKFPDDFPDDWKWCCGCLALAKRMLVNPSNYIDQIGIGYLSGRIYRKMTLVG